ncbi:MAG: hypothetical protein U5O15_11040 [Candidatus Krumholzibacteriota bacterium]|nr:hypothetical protein [Candidatus Krumholzibacteriota bacterium]
MAPDVDADDPATADAALTYAVDLTDGQRRAVRRRQRRLRHRWTTLDGEIRSNPARPIPESRRPTPTPATATQSAVTADDGSEATERFTSPSPSRTAIAITVTDVDEVAMTVTSASDAPSIRRPKPPATAAR